MTTVVPNNADPPVLFVHGLAETGRRFGRMAEAFRAAGREAHIVSYRPSDGSVGIDRLAGQLAAYIEKNLAPGRPFDLVGYSMGGLVSRYYIQRLGGIDRVRNLVTISSPHRGTLTAYLLKNDAARQMRPGSAFLADLNADTEWTRRIPWTSIWTPLDLIIIPSTRSRITPARDRRFLVLLHPWMVTSARVIRLVRDLCPPRHEI